MSSTFHCAGCSNQNGMPDLFCNPVFTSSSSPTILMSSVLFSEARVAVEGKLPVVPETILKRRKWGGRVPRPQGQGGCEVQGSI